MSKYATIEYTCDWCHSTEEELLLPRSGHGEYGSRSYEKLPEGWKNVGGEDICQDCAEAFEEWKKARK